MTKITHKYHPYILLVSLEEEIKTCTLSDSLFLEAPRVPFPGRPGHHQIHVVKRPASRLSALPPANPHSSAGPGRPVRWRDKSGRIHQRGLQQQ